MEGVGETIGALEGVAAGVSPVGPGTRAGVDATARELVALLRVAASSSGVPVAPRVARSAKATRAGVSVGDGTPVGRDGAPAYVLAWGSEHGPASGADVNHFAVPRSAGYWIKPAVDRARESAPATFEVAVAGTIRSTGL